MMFVLTIGDILLTAYVDARRVKLAGRIRPQLNLDGAGQWPKPWPGHMTTTIKAGGENMPNEKQLGLINQGVNAWNSWRGEHPYTRLNLILSNLSGVVLRGMDLMNATLSYFTQHRHVGRG